jgi:hypothetical protein
MYIINVVADDETKIGLYEKINCEKKQFEREIIDVVRSSYI